MAIDVTTPGKTNDKNATNSSQPARLLHESLHQIPQGIRFPLCGAISNALFLTIFNTSVGALESDSLTASNIYSIVYCLFIPMAHALNCGIVFGWPSPYLPNLAANAPIGLSAMVLGTVLTGYLDNIGMEATIDQFLLNVGIVQQPEEDEEKSEFYCSLIVMAVTGVWSYILSVYVNSSSSSKLPSSDLKKTN